MKLRRISPEPSAREFHVPTDVVPVSVMCRVRDTPPRKLDEAFDSIVGQTHKLWELVFVDDNSLDFRTLERLDSYENADRRVRVVRRKENGGLAIAYNDGVQAAKHELVALVDSDDVQTPDRLKTQIRYFLDHPETDVLGGAVEEFGDVERLNEPREVPGWSDWPIVWNCAVMFRRSTFLDMGGCDESLNCGEDTELHARMYRDGAVFRNVSEVVTRKRGPGERKYSSETRDAAKAKVLDMLTACFANPKVAFLCECLYTGGTEYWLTELVESTRSRVDWSVFVLHEQKNKLVDRLGLSCPIRYDRERAADFDKVIVWGQNDSDLLRRIKTDRNKLYLTSHTPDCDWGRKMVESFDAGLFEAVIGCTDRALAVWENFDARLMTINNRISKKRCVSLAPRNAVRELLGLSNKKVVGYIGRFSPEKRFWLPSQAVAMKSNEYECLMFGTGYGDFGYRKIDTTRCSLMGHVADVAPALAALDCLVVPSEFEAWPLVTAEAWAAGVPVVQTSTGLATENPEAVVIVPNRDDPVPIAEAVDSAIGNESLVEAGRKAVAPYIDDGLRRKWVETLYE